MEKIVAVFTLFYYQICMLAKILFAIKMATNVIKDFEGADLRKLLEDLMTGAIAYGSLFSIMTLLDAVEKAK